MKKTPILIVLFFGLFLACNSDENTLSKTSVTLKFTHNWDEVSVTQSDFNETNFTTANSNTLNIERLRYLLSKITITNINNQQIILKDHQLINIGDATNFELQVDNIATGDYTLSFTFGFSDIDNQDGVYQDLNTANFNVPGMLGGGYHYMQFDGKYIETNNQEAPFNYHAIRAVDRSNPNNLVFQDTSISVNLGTISIVNNTEVEVKMNIAEWFKNPNTWNLNELNTVLMPNFNAQKMMSENGKTVFSLGEVIHN